MATIDQIRQPVAQEFALFEQRFALTLTSDNPLLSLATGHVLRRGGKRMRPLLLLLAAKCFGPTVSDRAIDASIAIEMLHTASLLHDDVVDESDQRRGQPSVNALLGNQVAVLVGDYLFGKALEHATLCRDERVIASLARLSQALSDGELWQLSALDSQDISEEAYYGVIDKKTASLFATCAGLGGMPCGASHDEVEAMERYGLLVGRCFQMRDDLIDLDASLDAGKPAGNDLREGKLTLPVIYAALQTNEAFALALKIRRGEATAEDIPRMEQLAACLWGLEYADQEMRRTMKEARETIEPLAPSPAKDALIAFAEAVYARRK